MSHRHKDRNIPPKDRALKDATMHNVLRAPHSPALPYSRRPAQPVSSAAHRLSDVSNITYSPSDLNPVARPHSSHGNTQSMPNIRRLAKASMHNPPLTLFQREPLLVKSWPKALRITPKPHVIAFISRVLKNTEHLSAKIVAVKP